MAAVDFFNQNAVAHTWTYTLDKAADMISNLGNADLAAVERRHISVGKPTNC